MPTQEEKEALKLQYELIVEYANKYFNDNLEQKKPIPIAAVQCYNDAVQKLKELG